MQSANVVKKNKNPDFCFIYFNLLLFYRIFKNKVYRLFFFFFNFVNSLCSTCTSAV